MDFKLKKPELDPNIPYGQRLTVHIVDEMAKETPDRVLCKIAKSSDLSKGFLEITAGQVAMATDYMSYWLQEKLQRNGQETTISYMGLSDVRYWVMELAAIKIGSPILLPSLKNSTKNNESLFNDSKCRHLFYSEGNESRASGLASVLNDLHTFQIPQWSDLIAQDSKPYPYNDTWESAAKKPIMILHTSGSTGDPKPIVYNNAFVSMTDGGRKLPAVNGWEPTGHNMVAVEPGSEYYVGFPFFHMGGLALTLQPFWYDCVLVLGPTNVPPNGKIIIDILKHTKLACLSTPPSLLEDVVKEYQDEFEKYCSDIKLIVYGGGPLANFAGEYLSKRIPVIAPVIGSTEAGYLPLLSKEPEYWQAFHFHPNFGGVLFKPNPEDPDIYELVVKRVPGQEWVQGIFQNFPDIDEFPTKDYYKKHPTKKDFWLYIGRVDDMIVLSNGEKFIPVGMENMISSHPLVRSGLIVGQARFQCALILELKDDVEYDSKVIDDVWPVVSAANKHVPAHAQISKDLIILADPKKPFLRASKGTVQRYRTVKEYSPEIDALYQAFESRDPVANGLHIELSSATDATTVQQFLEDVISQILPGRKIQETDDFFVLGLDSLQTSHLSGTIRNALKDRVKAAENIGARFIYENPSISQLKAAILALATGEFSISSISAEDRMRDMVEKYTFDLPAKSTSKPKVDEKLNIVLTGSTGSLGFYIILALLANPNIGRIFCLDRSAGCEKKFFDRWAVLGEEHLTPAPGKMHFYQVEFGHPTFGLKDIEYSKIYNNANVIIHNAWKVNFNHPLTSFDNQIRSVQAFAHLSLTSPLHPEFCFVSSISTMGSYAGVIPERVVPEYSSPLPMGYGQSKYVSERILESAARERGVNMTVFRVGQIGGPVLRSDKGKWNIQEWFPSLVKTSGELGLIPKTLGNMDTVDWIPVDILGRVMVELIQLPLNNPCVDGAKVYNMTNPNHSSFSELLPSIKSYYAAKGMVLTEVSYGQWLDAIKKLGEDEQTLGKFPAKKIQDFFEKLSMGASEGGIFETEHLVHDSDNMKALTPVGTEWMNTWLSQWAY